MEQETESGRGQVHLAAASAAATHAGFIVVELDSYAGNMMDAIAKSYTYLTSHGIASGRV